MRAWPFGGLHCSLQRRHGRLLSQPPARRHHLKTKPLSRAGQRSLTCPDLWHLRTLVTASTLSSLERLAELEATTVSVRGELGGVTQTWETRWVGLWEPTICVGTETPFHHAVEVLFAHTSKGVTVGKEWRQNRHNEPEVDLGLLWKGRDGLRKEKALREKQKLDEDLARTITRRAAVKRLKHCSAQQCHHTSCGNMSLLTKSMLRRRTTEPLSSFRQVRL